MDEEQDLLGDYDAGRSAALDGSEPRLFGSPSYHRGYLAGCRDAHPPGSARFYLVAVLALATVSAGALYLGSERHAHRTDLVGMR